MQWARRRRTGTVKDGHVRRGGSWNDDQRLARAAFRRRGGPGSFGVYIGFRVVLAAPGS